MHGLRRFFKAMCIFYERLQYSLAMFGLKKILMVSSLCLMGCVAPNVISGPGNSSGAVYDSPQTGGPIQAGCSFHTNQIKAAEGTVSVVSCPSGCLGEGSVWGSNPYTADSNICHAAIHAGIISPDGGLVRVQKTAGQQAYRGTTANGVKSSDYGSYRDSAQLSPANN